VLVKATSAALGDHVGKLEASVRGESGQIAFNGRYLRDALEAIRSQQVRLQLASTTSPGVI
jgi:DNA polymerase III sliding clamp (beta) subunit (PCNA family)